MPFAKGTGTMKKKILLAISVAMLIIDILLIVLLWSNYMYHIASVDEVALGVFIGTVILVEAIIFTIHIMKGWENLFAKTVISVSLIFIMTTVGYKIYNDSVHCYIDYDNVFWIQTADSELSEEEIQEFIKDFNDAKYVKRNLQCEAEGTPDRTTTIILKDDTLISLDTFGKQIAVQVTGRSMENSCYWMEQKDVYEIIR